MATTGRESKFHFPHQGGEHHGQVYLIHQVPVGQREGKVQVSFVAYVGMYICLPEVLPLSPRDITWRPLFVCQEMIGGEGLAENKRCTEPS